MYRMRRWEESAFKSKMTHRRPLHFLTIPCSIQPMILQTLYYPMPSDTAYDIHNCSKLCCFGNTLPTVSQRQTAGIVPRPSPHSAVFTVLNHSEVTNLLCIVYRQLGRGGYGMGATPSEHLQREEVLATHKNTQYTLSR